MSFWGEFALSTLAAYALLCLAYEHILSSRSEGGRHETD